MASTAILDSRSVSHSRCRNTYVAQTPPIFRIDVDANEWWLIGVIHMNHIVFAIFISIEPRACLIPRRNRRNCIKRRRPIAKCGDSLHVAFFRNDVRRHDFCRTTTRIRSITHRFDSSDVTPSLRQTIKCLIRTDRIRAFRRWWILGNEDNSEWVFSRRRDTRCQRFIIV